MSVSPAREYTFVFILYFVRLPVVVRQGRCGMRLLNNVPEKDRFGYLLGLQVERHVQRWSVWVAWGLIGLGPVLFLLLMLWRILSQ